MGVTDEVKRVTKGAAGIAAATAGLSTCHDGGGFVIDPPPPPLICSDVSAGQSLFYAASRDGDVVTVTARPGQIARGSIAIDWRVIRVSEALGATILGTTLPESIEDSLVVRLQLNTPATTQVDFVLEAEFEGLFGERCSVYRTVHVTIAPNGVQVGQTNLDRLPLASREGARIVMVGQEGRTVALEAQTGFAGPHTAAWEVTGGSLDRTSGKTVRWTLPGAAGVYQAEVLLDYGPAGLAFDALVLEVRPV